MELPPGPFMCVVNDLNQRWVIDMGLPGPDAGKGGKHIILPPGYTGEVPAGYYTGTSTTCKVLFLVRCVPVDGDLRAALASIPDVRIQPLNPPAAGRRSSGST